MGENQAPSEFPEIKVCGFSAAWGSSVVHCCAAGEMASRKTQFARRGRHSAVNWRLIAWGITRMWLACESSTVRFLSRSVIKEARPARRTCHFQPASAIARLNSAASSRHNDSNSVSRWRSSILAIRGQKIRPPRNACSRTCCLTINAIEFDSASSVVSQRLGSGTWAIARIRQGFL